MIQSYWDYHEETSNAEKFFLFFTFCSNENEPHLNRFEKCVFFIVRKAHKSQEQTQRSQINISKLHVFPPKTFKWALYLWFSFNLNRSYVCYWFHVFNGGGTVWSLISAVGCLKINPKNTCKKSVYIFTYSAAIFTYSFGPTKQKFRPHSSDWWIAIAFEVLVVICEW